MNNFPYRIISGTQQEVKQRRFNIFVGISLGSRFFTKEKIKQYISWALQYTKEDVLVIIADKPHAINIAIKQHYSEKRAMNVALRKGKELLEIIKESVNYLPPTQRSLVKIIRWTEVENTPNYQKTRDILYDEFNTNSAFKDNILNIIKEHMKTGAIQIDQKEIKKLAQYVLDELPILLNGIEFQGKLYSLHPYHKISKVDELVKEMQEKTLFPHLAEKIGIKKIILVELKDD